MKRDSKERLFEVMSRLDKTFKPKLNENHIKLNEGIDQNSRGEILITGIPMLKQVINTLNLNNMKPWIMPKNKELYVSDVNDNGIVTNAGEIPWSEIDDRNTEKDGLMIMFENSKFKFGNDNYFYFKLEDSERNQNPYNFSDEKMADMKDQWGDYEDSLMEDDKTINGESRPSEQSQDENIESTLPIPPKPLPPGELKFLQAAWTYMTHMNPDINDIYEKLKTLRGYIGHNDGYDAPPKQLNQFGVPDRNPTKPMIGKAPDEMQ